MDSAVGVYTAGLSRAFPKKTFHVDVSEIMMGKPLGGPNAAVPKFREQVLKMLGANKRNPGFIGNMIRDPWKCTTFQKRC
jgi:hypothetical protein